MFCPNLTNLIKIYVPNKVLDKIYHTLDGVLFTVLYVPTAGECFRISQESQISMARHGEY
jgi:hypothetical protein